MNHTRTRITRRHKCEVCQKLYTCTRCSNYMEEQITKLRHGHSNPDSITHPECMKKFVCHECEK